MFENVVIVEAKRTPMGRFMGCLSTIPTTELGSLAIKACLEKHTVDHVKEVIMGCVLPAGLGQAPARQASLEAGLPISVGATTINKVCGSGMKAVMLANDLIKASSTDCVLAGGMESMSRAPYLLSKAREGYRIGHAQTLDHMMKDGLENAYDGLAMGCFAQSTADSEKYTREAMDAYAISSLNRAQHAIAKGYFQNEITPVTIDTKKGQIEVSNDENPANANIDKIAKLKAAFKKGGTVTAANSSCISDGAAALLIMSETKATSLSISPIARIVAHTTHAMKPEEFTVAPVGAIDSLLQKLGWKTDEVDLFEINEAFAMVSMLAIDKLGLDTEKVNINGGACALGHPIGASGARIIVTLIHALNRTGGKKGIASLCIGGGEATAIGVEMY